MATPAAAATAGAAPGGLSPAHFKAICADAGQWLWGTARGAFNEKATLSQIIVDAVIGMIPLVGDVTAVRDLIAIVIGLVDDPAKREQVWEWVLLIVLLFALIPVAGGVIKGVGRLVIKLAKEAELLVGAARAAHLAQGVKEIMAFLNRIGFKNAEAWFKNLRIGDYQAQLLARFDALLVTLNGALVQIQRKLGKLLPDSIIHRIEGLRNGLAKLKEIAAEMIPKAVKELDQQLRELQALVHSGGQTTSRTVAHEVVIGERAVTRADEARLMDHDSLPARSARGWKKNKAVAIEPETYEHVYTHQPGYPDLRTTKTDRCIQIEAFSGKIVNRPLKPGEQIYRLFGPEGVTHRTTVTESFVNGRWWGLGHPPATAKEWREKTAVLDEFNRDGFIVVGTVPASHDIKAAVGTTAEQAGERIPGQFLPGGAPQAVIDIEAGSKAALSQAAKEVMASGKAKTWIDPVSGMSFEVRATGWTDANGVWGYIRLPGQGTVQTARLGAREQASKENREVMR